MLTWLIGWLAAWFVSWVGLPVFASLCFSHFRHQPLNVLAGRRPGPSVPAACPAKCRRPGRSCEHCSCEHWWALGAGACRGMFWSCGVVASQTIRQPSKQAQPTTIRHLYPPRYPFKLLPAANAQPGSSPHGKLGNLASRRYDFHRQPKHVWWT